MADEWEQFKRGIKPVPRVRKARDAAVKAAPKPKKKYTTLIVPDVAAGMPKLCTAASGPPPVDDPELLRRLQRGEARREAELDLHQLTENEAYAAVMEFLARAVGRGWRIVLIITGRGAVLREVVPRWLTAHRAVRFFHPAARAHGGDGALYVVLRRVRKKDAG